MIAAPLLFLQAAGMGLSAFQSLEAGKIEEQALKFQANQEKINAQFRSNERTERLLNAMAANNAALGVRGVTSEGSPMTILEADFKRASDEAQTDLMDSRSAQLSLRSRAKAARQMSKIQAATSLIGGAANIGMTGGIKE